MNDDVATDPALMQTCSSRGGRYALVVLDSQLAIARMSVGIGEAGGVPPSYSIISDYFPATRRGTALGLFNLGPPIGQALGVAFGAKIAAAYDWRLAFVLLGAAGLIAAAAVWGMIREPRRGATDAQMQVTTATDRAAEAVSFWAALRMFTTQPTLALVSLASGATQFVNYGALGFTTLFLMREKAMTLNEIAIWCRTRCPRASARWPARYSSSS